MPDLETWTEGCKDSNCKLFITLFGKEPPLEDLKERKKERKKDKRLSPYSYFFI